jgi:hypothetical protein
VGLAEPGVIGVGGVRAMRFRMFSTQSISADPGAIGFGSSAKPPRGRDSPHRRADQSGRSQAGTPPDLACIKDGEKVASQCVWYSLYTYILEYEAFTLQYRTMIYEQARVPYTRRHARLWLCGWRSVGEPSNMLGYLARVVKHTFGVCGRLSVGEPRVRHGYLARVV